MKTSQTRKLTLIAGMIVMTFASITNAQGMRMSPQERAKILADSLALDSAQTAQVVAIYTDQQTQMKSIREEHQGNFEEMRGAMTDLRTKTDDKIMGILNDTQKAKFQEMIKNRPMGRMGGPRGGN